MSLRKQKQNLISFCIILLFFFNYSKAQTFLENSISSQNYSLSSPDVSSLEKYNLNEINHYVGKVNVEIPIYTIKTGNIEYPIKLVYNTGGIKVDQLASDVGLGWNITSAIVTRTVNQFNDFDNFGNIKLQSDYNDYTTEDQAANDTLDFKKMGYFLQKELSLPRQITPYQSVDFLPDLYHFYGNGASTSFFFNDINTPVEINPKGFKIEAFVDKSKINTNQGNYNSANIWKPLFNILTKDFFTLIITTPEGIKYTFSDCDFSINQILSGKSELESPAEISAWHITKIEDTKTGKKIDFIYEDTSSNPNHPLGSNEYFNKLVAQRTFDMSKCTLSPNQTTSIFYEKDIFKPTARVDVLKKRLKEIIFDEGEIVFNYNNMGIAGQPLFIRNDLYNADCLTQITLKNGTTDIKKYEFNYDYFNSDYNVGEFNPDAAYNSYRYKRLKLFSFNEVGKPQYLFNYDETSKLPPINSFSIDFLGYYNSSPDAANQLLFSSANSFPTLYYYQNQFERSLLPYLVSSMNPEIISGYFDRQANNMSKTWSLIKVKFPTGGSSEYNYESNQFEEFGQNILGGGVRISQQKINDGTGATRTINYSYLKINGITSGKLFSQPIFGYPLDGVFNYSINYSTNNGVTPSTIISTGSNSNISWLIYDKSHLNEDITTGSYIGYSRVVETEIGNGRSEYNFTSSNLPGFQNYIYRIQPQSLALPQLYISDLLYTGHVDSQTGVVEENSDGSYIYAIGNSGLFSNIYTDNSYKRGKLIEQNVFSESNQLLKKISMNYNDNLIHTYAYYQGFEKIVEKFPLTYYTFPVFISNSDFTGYSRVRDLSLFVRDNSEAFIIARKDIKVAQFLPSSKTISIYNSSGSINTEIMNYTFKPNGFVSTYQIATSNGNTINNVYNYPQDAVVSSEPYITNLINNNIVGIPLKTEVYKGLEKISENKIEFAKDASTNNLLLPKYIYAKKGADFTGNVLEKKLTYNSYDIKGNLTQYTQENDIPMSLIWGYHNTMLLAKIENIAYLQIPPALITDAQNASDINNNEATILVALDAIRNNAALERAYVTTYTHLPLIGISTVTDAKGDKIIYTYDASNRLKCVKDKNGNILSENQYNYKP